MRVTIQSEGNYYIDTLEKMANAPSKNNASIGTDAVSESAGSVEAAESSDTLAARESFQTLLNSAIDDLTATTSSEDDTTLDAIFTKASETYGIDKNLLLAIGYHESRFTADATSSKGAMGIMQLMPKTAEAMGVTDAYDPEQNIMGAAKLLDILLDRYNGDTTLALAAYAAGGSAVDKAGGVPSATVQKYIDDILAMAQSGISAPDADVSTTAADAEASVASSVKEKLADFPNHSSYNVFLAEFAKELSADDTASDDTDAAAAQKILMERANRALQNTITRVKAQDEGDNA